MVISGIQSSDLGIVSPSIPQKSDEFQVRNSFVQRCEKEKSGFERFYDIKVDECDVR